MKATPAAPTGDPTADLSVDGVTVSYGRTPVLHGVDLDVPGGTVAGIVGESGSGKTTLARCLTGQVTPTGGTVTLGGQRLTHRRTVAQRRALQMIYQDPFSSLNPRLTVGQTLTELLAVHRLVPRAERPARAAELLDLVGLPPEALRARPRQFSGGQRQRIAIARALAVEPRVLVADEPTSALDVAVRATILDLFARLRDGLGVTIVLISHDLSVVAHMCDTVTVLRDGRVVEHGGARDVLRHPEHAYTRSLIAAVPRLPRPAEPREATA
ncbi:ABC transporter ATP-binding protein [Streptomyces radicis]|uniref:ABC transporter ATP-binding protein n=1 Tax=Streptomyces radicis TaxID=1750517 RepID=A0A3A9WIN2_9ACTN|nr:ATP-binding cassette domain-containing protein [Streptomyces radicis]RKN12835.1 ABC transporter ATP-binding protein [Streptomyces radicis]RKN27400.1 ABC transporter ATP-binding protein [Streptomyces radicis]